MWEERRREGLLLKGQVAPKEGDTGRAQATVVEEITSRLDGAVHCRGWWSALCGLRSRCANPCSNRTWSNLPLCLLLDKQPLTRMSVTALVPPVFI